MSDTLEVILTNYLDTTAYDEFSDELVSFVEMRFVDTIGVMIAGSNAAASKILKDIHAGSQDEPDAPAGAINRGLVFGTMGHALDYDDTNDTTKAHISVPIISAILAISAIKSVSGQAAIESYVKAFETVHYVGDVIMDSHDKLGWHSTATLGTFSAAIAASNLLDHDEDQISTTLNICPSFAAGTKANFGTLTKPVHAGHATKSGITAAFLAEHGCSAGSTSISGENGFVELFSDSESRPSRRELGDGWACLQDGVSAKKYPCSLATHGGIEGVLRIRDKEGLDFEDIKTLTVTTSKIGENVKYRTPEVPSEARFSMHYCIACALVYGQVAYDHFSAEDVRNHDLEAMMSIIDHKIDPSMPYDYTTTTEITTKSGDIYQDTVDEISISSMTELEAKFSECTKEFSESESRDLYEILSNAREISDMKEDVLSFLGYSE